MTNEKTREDFEAWAKSKGAPKEGWWLRQIDDGGYSCGPVDDAWNGYQAATQHSAARIAELKEHLKFVERWANHHGAKPHTTQKAALSVIQHYPPIKAITRSYKGGVVPDTFDPYARIAELEAEVQALRRDAERLDWIAINGTFGVDSSTGLTGGNGLKRKAATRKAIDAAIEAERGGA